MAVGFAAAVAGAGVEIVEPVEIEPYAAAVGEVVVAAAAGGPFPFERIGSVAAAVGVVAVPSASERLAVKIQGVVALVAAAADAVERRAAIVVAAAGGRFASGVVAAVGVEPV